MGYRCYRPCMSGDIGRVTLIKETGSCFNGGPIIRYQNSSEMAKRLAENIRVGIYLSCVFCCVTVRKSLWSTLASACEKEKQARNILNN